MTDLPGPRFSHDPLALVNAAAPDVPTDDREQAIRHAVEGLEPLLREAFLLEYVEGTPSGTFRIGTVTRVNPSLASAGFSGGYSVRRSDGVQLFLADSGTLSITETANHVSGTFALYAKHYDVIPLPTPENTGKPITPLSSGESPLTISGSFDAVRR